jgi:hypothetical protein
MANAWLNKLDCYRASMRISLSASRFGLNGRWTLNP